jgi:hypothetical protein
MYRGGHLIEKLYNTIYNKNSEFPKTKYVEEEEKERKPCFKLN